MFANCTASWPQRAIGGRAHFGAGQGLRRVKHQCLHRGEDLGRRRDDDTLELFEYAKAK